MKRLILVTVCTIAIVSTPVAAQEKVYPVRGEEGFGSMRVQSAPSSGDPARFIAEKAEYSLRLGFPTEVEAGSLPDNGAKVLVFWLKIQNLSDRPMTLDVSKFTAAGEDGRTYPMLSPDEALNRIFDAKGLTGSVLSKATQGVSLGRLGKSDEAQARDEAKRFNLQSGPIQPQTVKEGLLFFEAPSQKRFTISLGLGDLWSKRFIFTNVKPRS